MTPYDPNKPLPVWTHQPGEERDPERIDVLIEQLRDLWRRYPSMRLGQVIVSTVDPDPNPLFNLEDHVLSERICAVRDSGQWPTRVRGDRDA
jgi:hypothetical protein